MSTRIVEIRQGILNKNDQVAAGLRQRYAEANVLVVNLVSSPGTGKTAWLHRTLEALRVAGRAVSVLVGDLETDHDARRLSATGCPARQINTHGRCHLEAEVIGQHLDAWQGEGSGWRLEDQEILFIENVGNLVCPSSYDLGEGLRVVLLSVTEGEDKPLKYPGIFNSSDAALVTKSDLAEACDFDLEAALANLRTIRPGIPVFVTSAKTGEGLDAWLDFLAVRHRARTMERPMVQEA